MHIKNWSLTIAILVVFLTASYFIFYGYKNAQTVYQQTADAINDHQLKKELLTTMYNASQERSEILNDFNAIRSIPSCKIFPSQWESHPAFLLA